MTEFLDLLETQLIDAAGRRRERPRLLPRIDALVATAAVAAGVALVVALGGGSGQTHSGRTPAAAPVAAIGDRARGVTMAVLGGDRVGVEKLAYRLSRATSAPVRTGDDPIADLPGTDVLYAPGYGGAALAVSEFVTGIPQQLATLRVAPLDAVTARVAGPRAHVVVRLGRDSLVVPPSTGAVAFRDGCPDHARLLASGDVQGAVASVLQAWPAADRAVIGSAHVGTNSDRGAQARYACGAGIAARTVVITLDLTAYEPSASASEAVLFVSCEGDGWRVWQRAH